MLNRIDRSDLKDRIFHWPELAVFKEEEAEKTFMYETPNTVGAIWCMKPGQELPVHSHKAADDIWIVIQGEAEYYPNETDVVDIKAGDVILAAPNEIHGMKNTSDDDFLMLGIAGPTPIGFEEEEHQFKK